MNELVRQSKEIYDVAVSTYKPKAIVLMFSGGDDSMAAYHVCKELGIKLDYVIHGNTRTGIEETTLFARKTVEILGDKYLEADAGSSYVDYVMRKGFFGKGNNAHNFSYHVLKSQHFGKTVSRYLRQRRKNFPVLFINGARQSESERRKVTMVSPYKVDTANNKNIWVNIINHWPNHAPVDYLESNGIERNSVSKLLCRSGECMCGTMQTAGDRNEAAFYFPKWGKQLDDLDKKVQSLHGWGWNDKGPSKKQIRERSQFHPMCTGCKINYNKSAQLQKNIAPNS